MYSVPVIVSRAHMEPQPHNIFLQFWFLGLWISSINCNGTRPSKTDASCSSAVSLAYSYSPNFLLFPQERSFIFNKSYPIDQPRHPTRMSILTYESELVWHTKIQRSHDRKIRCDRFCFARYRRHNKHLRPCQAHVCFFARGRDAPPTPCNQTVP